jgi:hypothetical protein
MHSRAHTPSGSNSGVTYDVVPLCQRRYARVSPSNDVVLIGGDSVSDDGLCESELGEIISDSQQPHQ